MKVQAIHELVDNQKVAGFLPENEAQALFAMAAAQAHKGPLLEIGSFCGRSAVYLGFAARSASTVVFTVDHHLGSEEHQPGEEYYEPCHYNKAAGRVDTLPNLRDSLRRCEVEDVVIPIVGRSEILAEFWGQKLALVFIDGGHSEVQAMADCKLWVKHLAKDGVLAIHDIFENPSDGGQAPYRAMMTVKIKENLVEIGREGSLIFLGRKDRFNKR